MAKKEGLFSAITGSLLNKDKEKDKKSPRVDEKQEKKTGGSGRSDRPQAPKIAVTEAEQPFVKSIPAGMLRVFLPDDQSVLVVQQSDQSLADLFASVQKKYPMLLRDPTIWEFRGGSTPGVFSHPQWPNVTVGSRNQIALMKHVNNIARVPAGVVSPKPSTPAAASTLSAPLAPSPPLSSSPAPESRIALSQPAVHTPVAPSPLSAHHHNHHHHSTPAPGDSSPAIPSLTTSPAAPQKQSSPRQDASSMIGSPSAPSSGIARPIRVRVGEHGGAELDVHAPQPNARLSALLHQLETQLAQHHLSLPAPAPQCEFRTPTGRPLRLDEAPPEKTELLLFVPRDVVVTLPDGTTVKMLLNEHTTVAHLLPAILQHECAREVGVEWVLVSADDADVLTMSSASTKLLEVCPTHRSFHWRKLFRRELPARDAIWSQSTPGDKNPRSLFGALARSFAEDFVLAPSRVCLPVDLWTETTPIPHQLLKTQLLEWLSDTLARLRFVAAPQRCAELETLKASLVQIAEHLSGILVLRASVAAPSNTLAVPRGPQHARTPSSGGPSTLKEIQQRAITVPTFLIGVQNFVHASISFAEVYRPWSIDPHGGAEARKLVGEVLEIIDQAVVRGFMMDDIYLHLQKYLRRSVEEML